MPNDSYFRWVDETYGPAGRVEMEVPAEAPAPAPDSDGIEMRIRTWVPAPSRLVMGTFPVDGAPAPVAHVPRRSGNTYRSLFAEIERTVAPPPKSTKKSMDYPNTANNVHRWLKERWPEVMGMEGIWITGSTVWSFLYNSEPPEGCDLDIICENDDIAAKLTAKLNPTEEQTNYLSGKKLTTKKGKVDVWVNALASSAIMAYPTESHSHCRAAYSPTRKLLLVQANETAW